MRYENFLIKNAQALESRWKVLALLVNPKPLAFASNDMDKGIHAEERCLSMIEDARGATMYVVRTRKDGTLGLAKPCEKRCQGLLSERGVKRVYYSTSYGGWEVWTPNEEVSDSG